MTTGILLTDSVETDDRISLADACKLLPCRSGKRPHIYTVRRWVRSGVKSESGQVVRLQAFRLGGCLYTKKSWIEEFIVSLTDGVIGSQQPTQRRSGGLSMARRRLIARGMYGKQAKADLLGL